jgi:hypothetical protein
VKRLARATILVAVDRVAPQSASVGRTAMLGDGALSFREFTMREPLPLAEVHEAVLEFLRADGTSRWSARTPSTPTCASRA